MENEKKIALLIDCDNARAEAIWGIMEALSNHGETSIRRAYGNWKQNSAWEDKLHPFAIQPVQQFANTKGKNATDLAMTIDAMEILFAENVDIFAIVSSDSDFTPLAMKLRAKSKRVLGFGEKKTPQPFIDSCNEFVYVDGFRRPTENGGAADGVEKWDKKRLRSETRVMNAIRKAIDEEMDDDGWALASAVSQQVNRQIPLSPRNYGYVRWAQLVQATEFFETKKNSAGQLCFRLKKK